jgi:uncharacterized protein YjbJ (UPF0337 family)
MVIKDQIKSHTIDAKGKVKEVVGKFFGDKTPEFKGVIEKNVCNI